MLKFAFIHKIQILLLSSYILSLLFLVYDSNLIFISELILFLFLIVTILFFLYEPKKFPPQLFLFLSFVFVAFLSLVYSSVLNQTVDRFVSLIQLTGLMLTTFMSIKSKKDYVFLIKVIYYSLIIYSVYSLLYFGYDGLLYAYENGLGFSGFAEYKVQQNVFGFYMAISYIFSLYFFLSFRKFYYLIFSLPGLLLGLLSSSRRAQLIVILGTFLVILITFIFDKKVRTLFLLLFFALLIIIFSIDIESVPFLYRISRLFMDGDFIPDGSLNIRIELIIFGFNNFLNSPILGSGFYSFRFIYFLEYGRAFAPHNGFIERLSDTGILGFSFYYGFISLLLIVLFKKALKLLRSHNKDYHFFLFIFIFIFFFLFSDIATTSIFDKFQYIAFGLALSIINFKTFTYS